MGDWGGGMVVELRSTETFTVKWEESCSFKLTKNIYCIVSIIIAGSGYMLLI